MNDVIRNGEPLERAIALLREPVPLAADLPARVTAARTAPRRPLTLRLAAGAALAAIAAVILVTGRSRGETPVDFSIAAPAGATVDLVGDFTDWQSNRVHLQLEGAGLWHATVKLRPGRYRFAYVINHDQWRADAHAAEAPDDFGRPTSVLTVADH